MSYETKVYIVQKANRDGTLGQILAAKLSFGTAHQIAKKHAPAKVHFVIADKTVELNVPADHPADQTLCNQLQIPDASVG